MRFDDTKAILVAFERERVRYVVVGSMAMAAHGLVRATQDVDLFVDPAPENVDRMKRALRSIFDDESIEEIGRDDLAGAYPVVRYAPPDSDFVLDLIARLGDAFAFEDVEFEEVRLGDLTVRVATPRMLYRMKRDTVRAQDRADAEQLRERFGLD